MAIKKKTDDATTKKQFDTMTFDAFVTVMRNASGKYCKQNEIPLSFKYLGIKYTSMLFKYKRDANDRITCVVFSLPEIPENRHLSCYVVGGANNAEDAIQSLRKFVDGKYA